MEILYQLLLIYMKNIFEYFYEFIINLFTEKIIQISNEEFREKIFEIIIKDKNLIKISKSFFWLFLKRFKLIPINDDKKNASNNSSEKEIKNFLSFIKDKDKNLKQLNDNSPNNEYLNEILISIFEIYINSYLKEIKNNVSDNVAIKYFEKSVKFLEKENESNEKILINLGNLYSITYIKCYLIKLIEIIYNNQKKDENERKENDLIKPTKINNILIDLGDSPINNVIKIYILKCFRYKMNNINEFNNYNWEEIGFNWAENYVQKNKNLISSLEFLFLNIDNRYLNDFYKKISLDKNIKFKNVNNERLYLDLIQNDFFEFIDISINVIFSDLLNSENFNNQIYSNFCKFSKKLFRNLPERLQKCLNIFFDEKYFQSTIKNNIREINDSNKNKCLLFSYKISLLISSFSINNFYTDLLSENCQNTIKNNFLPGAEPVQNPFIDTLNLVEEHFNLIKGDSPGAYVCDCGFFYQIEN